MQIAQYPSHVVSVDHFLRKIAIFAMLRDMTIHRLVSSLRFRRFALQEPPIRISQFGVCKCSRSESVKVALARGACVESML
jgi:hypothetical protein